LVQLLLSTSAVENLNANQTKISHIRLFHRDLLPEPIIRSSLDPASIAFKTNFWLKLPTLPSISGKRFVLYIHCSLVGRLATVPPCGYIARPPDGRRLAARLPPNFFPPHHRRQPPILDIVRAVLDPSRFPQLGDVEGRKSGSLWCSHRRRGQARSATAVRCTNAVVKKRRAEMLVLNIRVFLVFVVAIVCWFAAVLADSWN
jgi:hypothetical protein